MDRCANAYAYHKAGYNCAQSVAAACADLAGWEPEALMSAMGGFGGGRSGGIGGGFGGGGFGGGGAGSRW